MAGTKLEGSIPIDLDKRRYLKMTWRSCRLFEELAGCSVDSHFQTVGLILQKHKIDPERFKDEKYQLPPEVSADVMKSSFVGHLSILLWAFLEHEDRKLMLDRVEDELMDKAEGETMDEKATYIGGRLLEAYKAAKIKRDGEQWEETQSPPASLPAGGTS